MKRRPHRLKDRKNEVKGEEGKKIQKKREENQPGQGNSEQCMHGKV